MSNPLLGMLPTGNGNPAQMLEQLKRNPIGMLRQMGLNVPENMSDPQSIIQYLMNSGQVSQSQLNQARQMARMFGGK